MTSSLSQRLGALLGLLCCLSYALANFIVEENKRPGDGNWAARMNSADGLEAYSLVSSGAAGDVIPWRISTTANRGISVTAVLYRIGYYQGFGGAQIARFTNINVRSQGPCRVTDPVSLLYECPWDVTWEMPIGNDWVTGLYQVNWYSGSNLTPSSLTWFVVRDDRVEADIVFMQSEYTFYAYNPYGWYSAYQAPMNPALNPTGTYSTPKSSLHRPLGGGMSFDVEMAWRAYRHYAPSMIHYLESNGYSTTYIMQQDLEDKGPQVLQGHKVFLTQGHCEYWTASMRTTMEVAKQTNLIHQVYYGSNNVYWQVHFEDNSKGERNTVMNHKYNSADGTFKMRSVNPLDPTSYKSKALRTSIFDEVYPQRSLFGVTFLDYGVSTDCYNIQASNMQDKYWANSDVGQGPTGSCVVGYEWDGVLQGDADTPAGITILMNTTISSKKIQCHAVRLEDPSGCIVFAAGANHLSWALVPPDMHRGYYNFIFNPDQLWWRPLYQLTYNMFKDMGVRPATPTKYIVQ